MRRLALMNRVPLRKFKRTSVPIFVDMAVITNCDTISIRTGTRFP
ncbi:MAG: hypothetical protein P8175_19350 [Deltaproteobacteria bacterium]